MRFLITVLLISVVCLSAQNPSAWHCFQRNAAHNGFTIVYGLPNTLSWSVQLSSLVSPLAGPSIGLKTLDGEAAAECIFVPTNNGLYCYGREANLWWFSPTSTPIRNVPLFTGNNQVICGTQDSLIAFDVRNGSRLWQKDLDNRIWYATLFSDRIYVTDNSGKLWALTVNGDTL